jgi:hypothetical protein
MRVKDLFLFNPSQYLITSFRAGCIIQRNISGIAGLNRSVHLELQGETLVVEGYKIATMTHALHEFRKIMLAPRRRSYRNRPGHPSPGTSAVRQKSVVRPLSTPGYQIVYQSRNCQPASIHSNHPEGIFNRRKSGTD